MIKQVNRQQQTSIQIREFHHRYNRLCSFTFTNPMTTLTGLWLRNSNNYHNLESHQILLLSMPVVTIRVTGRWWSDHNDDFAITLANPPGNWTTLVYHASVNMVNWRTTNKRRNYSELWTNQLDNKFGLMGVCRFFLMLLDYFLVVLCWWESRIDSRNSTRLIHWPLNAWVTCISNEGD